MRSSSTESITRPVARCQQSFARLMQREAAIAEFQSALPAPVQHAAYGKKVTCPELSQLASNVGRATNKAAETTIAICYGALDVGVPLEIVLRVPEKLTSLIRGDCRGHPGSRSRCDAALSRSADRRTLREHAHRPQSSRARRRRTTWSKARRRIAELKRVLEELDLEFERQINESILGPVERRS